MAVLLRLLASKAGESKKNSEEPGPTSTPEPRRTPLPLSGAPADSDEERIRKFLEALGVPTTSPPPPPVTPKSMDLRRAADEARHQVDELRRAAERKAQVLRPKPHIPPLTTFPPPVPVAEEIAPPAPVVEQRHEKERLFESPVFKAGEMTVVSPPSTIVETPITSPPLTAYEAQTFAPTLDRSLGALLMSPEGLRRAIMLREIFGPPRSLQPLELVGTA
jgi:hypothetical protein